MATSLSSAAISFSAGGATTSKAFSPPAVALIAQPRRRQGTSPLISVGIRRVKAVESEQPSQETPDDSSAEATSTEAAVATATDAGQGNGEPENVDAESAQAAEGVNVPAKPRMVYPKGLAAYETMAVLRPSITEEQRLALSQRYEEAIIASGGMDVEVFNRGILPLAYPITKKNTRGEKSVYLDGIYYLFTYATKPSSQKGLEKRFQMDDDIIRVLTFKLSNKKEVLI